MVIVVDNEFNWKEACIAIEEQHRLWTSHDNEMDYFKFNDGIFAACDSVHLMQVWTVAISDLSSAQIVFLIGKEIWIKCLLVF